MPRFTPLRPDDAAPHGLRTRLVALTTALALMALIGAVLTRGTWRFAPGGAHGIAASTATR